MSTLGFENEFRLRFSLRNIFSSPFRSILIVFRIVFQKKKRQEQMEADEAMARALMCGTRVRTRVSR